MLKSKSFLIAALLLSSGSAFAQTATVNPSQYSVTLKQLDLCEDVNCASYATLGSSTTTIDIASVSAGADAAQYANIAVPPLVLGRTYTHVRIKISGTFNIKGYMTSSPYCSTRATLPGTVSNVSSSAAQAAAAAYSADLPGAGVDATVDAALSAAGITRSGSDLIIKQSITPITVTAGATPPSIVVKFDTQNTVLFVNAPTSCAGVFPTAPSVTLSQR